MHKLTPLVFLVGLFTTMTAPYVLHRYLETLAFKNLEQKIQGLTEEIENNFDANLSHIKSMQAFFRASSHVDQDEFVTFSNALLADNPNIEYLIFAPANQSEPPYYYPEHERVQLQNLNQVKLEDRFTMGDVRLSSHDTNNYLVPLSFPVSTGVDDDGTIQKGHIIAAISWSYLVRDALQEREIVGLRVNMQATTTDRAKNAGEMYLYKGLPIHMQKRNTVHKVEQVALGTKTQSLYLTLPDDLSEGIWVELLLATLLGVITLSSTLFLLQITKVRKKELLHQQELEQKVAEANQANNAKSSFLANMTHELRTPLNSIIGMLRFLRETPLDSEQEDMVDTVQASSGVLLGIVNDILDLSKIEANEAKLEHVGFDIISVIQRAYRAVQPLTFHKKINLELDFADEVLALPFLVGDPLRVTQIVTNLISNAVKYTEKGSVTLALSSAILNEKQAHIQLAVKDTGIGIHPEKIDSIFEKFAQEDTSTTRKYGGTGLGLAITQKIVHMMGGTITVESQVGMGSTFTVDITFDTTNTLSEGMPSSRTSGMVRNQLYKTSNLKRIPVAKARILIAEDHLLNQTYMRKVMRKYGIEHYTIVPNGLDAVKAYQKVTFDLIMMDCFMPIMNGYDASKTIRDIERKQNITQIIPIIAMTANAMSGDSQKCFDAEMSAYVPKPIDTDDLKMLLSEWLDFGDPKESTASKEQTIECIHHPANLTQLKEFAAGDKETERELIDAFIMQSNENMDKLCASTQSNDNDIWVSAAHMLKGGAGGIGAETLRTLCAEAQEMKSSSAQEKITLYAAIETAYLEVKRYLRDQGFNA